MTRHLCHMAWLMAIDHAKKFWREWDEYRVAVRAYKRS